jgi:hypothetical protein
MDENDRNQGLLLSEGGSRKAREGERGAALKQATAVQHGALSL